MKPPFKYTDPRTAKLSDIIKKDKKVKFQFFRDNAFWYETEDGLLFPISLEEVTNSRATFLAEDKVLFFMRWIRKYLESVQNEN